MTKEVMKQALEVLKSKDTCGSSIREAKEYVIKALEEALKQEQDEPLAYINVEQRKIEWAKYTFWETPTVVNLPKIPLYTTPQPKQEEDEPVAYIRVSNTGHVMACAVTSDFSLPEKTLLYTTPQTKEWVALTDEQIEEIWGNTPMMLNSHNNRTRIVFAKAIEAKLKEKNA